MVKIIKLVVLHKKLPTGPCFGYMSQKIQKLFFLFKECNRRNGRSNRRREQLKHITTLIILNILNLLETLERMARYTGQHLAPALDFGQKNVTSGQTRAMYAVLAPLR